MAEFIGAECLIAKMLVEKGEQDGKQQISTAELNRLGICVRRLSIDEGVGAVFLTSREDVYSAVYDYSDYFQCVYDADDKFVGIKINENKNNNDLIGKFIKFLPKNIQDLLDEALNEASKEAIA